MQEIVEQERESWNLVENNRQKTKFTSDDKTICSGVQYKQYQLGFVIKSH